MRLVFFLVLAGVTFFGSFARGSDCSSVLLSGQQLTAEQRLCSPSGAAVAVLHDGNFIVTLQEKTHWQTGTSNATRLRMRANCDLVLYANDTAVWSSQSAREAERGCLAQLDDSGELRVYFPQDVWESSSQGAPGCEIHGSREANTYAIYANGVAVETTPYLANIPYFLRQAVDEKNCRMTPQTRETLQRMVNPFGSRFVYQVNLQMEKFRLR